MTVSVLGIMVNSIELSYLKCKFSLLLFMVKIFLFMRHIACKSNWPVVFGLFAVMTLV
jgi:hypothetical protein